MKLINIPLQNIDCILITFIVLVYYMCTINKNIFDRE